ncbi:Small ubiquitin- modifier 1, partial [Tulasnella sp. 418]
MSDNEAGDRSMVSQDVKPKVQVNVVTQDGNTLKFMTKRTVSLAKVFKATEERMGATPGTLRFMHNGKRLQVGDTLDTIEFEDGDQIDALLHQ